MLLPSEGSGLRAARLVTWLVAASACSLPFDDIGFGTGGTGGSGAGQGGATSSSMTTASSMPGSTSNASTSEMSSSVTGLGGADCTGNANGLCIPEPPTGWQGPVFAPENPQLCPQPVLSGGLATDPNDPDTAVGSTPLVCACTCTPQPDQCDSIIVDPICSTGTDPFSVAVGACVGAPIVGPNGNDVTLSAPDIGQCAVSGTLDVAGTVSLVDPRNACDLPMTTEGCGMGEVCVAAGDPNVCVWQIGEHDCTSATGYPFKSVLVGGTTDTRTCTAGTCNCGGSPNGCVGVIEVFDSTLCTGISDTLTTAAGCSAYDPPFPVVSARYTLANPNFTCGSSGSASQTGSVGALAAQVHTLCCLSQPL